MTQKRFGAGGTCCVYHLYIEVLASWQPLIKQDNVGVWKASFPEKKHISQHLVHHGNSSSSGLTAAHPEGFFVCMAGGCLYREPVFSPSSEHVSSAASVGRTTHKAKPVSRGYRCNPYRRETALGLHQSEPSPATVNHLSRDIQHWDFSLCSTRMKGLQKGLIPFLFFQQVLPLQDRSFSNFLLAAYSPG